MVGSKKWFGVAVLMVLTALGAGIGGFVNSAWEKAELQEVRSRLAVSEKRMQDLESELGRRTDRLAELEQSAEVASADLRRLQRVMERAAAEPKLEITQELLRERLSEARKLESEGRMVAALETYAWLLDVGEPALAQYSGVGGEVIQILGRLGESDARAANMLRERRDTAEAKVRAGETDGGEIQDFVAMSRALGELERAILLFDETSDQSIKRGLQIYLRRDLIELQRYEDAYLPGSHGRALNLFEMNLSRVRSSKSEIDPFLKSEMMARSIKSAALDLELLAGAGHSEEAMELAAKVLEADRSADTVEALRAHLQRAGQERILEILLREMR